MSRCHLCQAERRGLVEHNGLLFCSPRNRPNCNLQARLRLGVPKWLAYRLYGGDKA
jgi:hypothetical protein